MVDKGLSRYPDSTSPEYQPPPLYQKMISEKDTMVPMRDGVKICVDIFRPEAVGKFPALLAIAYHNKDVQSPEVAASLPPQPAWSKFWFGNLEAGDSRYFVSRGYVHIIGNPRGVGKSEDGGSAALDFYDLIEWIAAQPWCDGNVGMVGLSAYGGMQLQAAMQNPPHLKAIFAVDPRAAYPFRDRYPGGILHAFWYLLDPSSVVHSQKGRPGKLPPEQEKLWQNAMNNPDYRMYQQFYNILTMKGQLMPDIFNALLYPYETQEGIRKTEANYDKINIPAYLGSGMYSYTYKQHWQGSQHWYAGIKSPKKLMFVGSAHLERPYHAFHNEILKWYDYWLKGIDTGIMKEPPVKFWVNGANEWRYADDWPLPQTAWKKYYLHSWERLRTEPFMSSAIDGYETPDAFIQMPPTHTNVIQKLRYMTEPLAKDTMVAGPISLTVYAEIDQPDTNWIVILKDVGPDFSIQTAREGETAVPSNLPEKELTRGWLKASHRAVDKSRSKPGKPWHPYTREASQPVKPGEITEYQIEILSTANLFREGHRICIDITCLDLSTGVSGASNVEYIPYHICSSQTTVHRIYHNEKYPSHLLLPVIPE